MSFDPLSRSPLNINPSFADSLKLLATTRFIPNSCLEKTERLTCQNMAPTFFTFDSFAPSR
jgi:hypothetical protein